MKVEPEPVENPQGNQPVNAPQEQNLTDGERAQLHDAKLQEEYRAEFIRQMRARHCPGCGETELF